MAETILMRMKISFCTFLLAFICTGPAAKAAVPEGGTAITFAPVSVFEMTNHGSYVDVRSLVAVEQKNGDRWEKAVEGDFLNVTLSSGKTPECLNLGQNGVLTVGPWDGMSCSGPSCDGNGPLPDGIYRYVVTSCDGKTDIRFASF